MKKLSEVHEYFFLDTLLRATYEEAGLKSIALASNGRIAWGDPKGRIVIWDIKSWRKLRVISGEDTDAIAFGPNGDMLVTGKRVLDVESGETVTELQSFPWSGMTAIAFSPDGKKIAGGAGSHYPAVFDAGTGVKTLTLAAAKTDRKDIGFVCDVSFSLRSNKVAASWERTVSVWDLKEQQEVAQFSFPNTVTAFALGPFGRLLATASLWDNDNIAIWDLDTRRQTAVLKGHRDIIDFLRFLPDGELLVSIARDGNMRFWDVKRAECVRIVRVGTVECADVSPDGRLLAIARSEVVVLYGVEGSNERGKTEVDPRTLRDSLGMELLLIPSGDFLTGSSERGKGRANGFRGHNAILVAGKD